MLSKLSHSFYSKALWASKFTPKGIYCTALKPNNAGIFNLHKKHFCQKQEVHEEGKAKPTFNNPKIERKFIEHVKSEAYDFERILVSLPSYLV